MRTCSNAQVLAELPWSLEGFFFNGHEMVTYHLPAAKESILTKMS